MARSSFLKKPGVEHNYSPDEVHELLKCSRDPIYFIENYCKIIHPVHGLVNFELYDYQKEMINLFNDFQFSILCASRQSGKSQTSCAFLLWYAIFNELKTVLIVSNKSFGAKEMVDRIIFMYEHLPDFIRPGIDPNNWNKLSIKFDNGSKIVSEATTVNSGRGLSISLCFCDEFAFTDKGNGNSENSVSEAFWTSISPTLATGGKCIIASTPNGDDNLYATLWRGAESGSNGFGHLMVTWDKVPGRDEEFRKKEVAKIGEEKFNQEYACHFISSDPLLFNSTFLSNYKLESQPVPDSRGVLFFEEIVQHKSYLIAIDPATGNGQDYSVIIVYSFPDLHQVAEYRSNSMSSVELYNVLKYLLKTIMSKRVEICYWSFENNGVGEGVLALYESDDKPVEYGELVSESGKKRVGFYTSGKSKLKSCITFKSLFEKYKIKVRSRNTLSEMKNYIRRNGTYAARGGSTDDTISAHLILIRMLEDIMQYEEAVYNIMTDDDFVNEFDNEDIDGDQPLPILSNYDSAFNDPFREFFDYMN